MYHSYPWFWEVGIHKCQQWTHNTLLWCQEHGVVYNGVFIFVFLYAHFLESRVKVVDASQGEDVIKAHRVIHYVWFHRFCKNLICISTR